MPKPMTNKELRQSPGQCPLCRSTSVDYGGVEIDGTEATQEATCFDCFAEWTEIYTFKGYVLTREPEGKTDDQK